METVLQQTSSIMHMEALIKAVAEAKGKEHICICKNQQCAGTNLQLTSSFMNIEALAKVCVEA